MKVIGKTGRDDIANVYLADFNNGSYVEFVESVEPPIPREDKWVLIVSTLFGCPVKCPICDAGGWYKGKLSKDEILSQINYMIENRFPNKVVDVKKFKIQFARMGEPAFNMNVIDVLKELPSHYDAKGLMPCISTVAPKGTGKFFDELLEVKESLYKNSFQFQFSIHSTDKEVRDRLIPIKKWDLNEIANYGERFFNNDKRKITLNFALSKSSDLDIDILKRHFNPDVFIIKVTPINPTFNAKSHKIESLIEDKNKVEYQKVIDKLKSNNYDVILSIGEREENKIGSNCGQYVKRFVEKKEKIVEAYKYEIIN